MRTSAKSQATKKQATEHSVARNKILADRVRRALDAKLPVEEKKMFGGLTFMVRGKMCVSAGKDRFMFRIDPAIHDTVVTRKGCRAVVMKGREYKGYVHVEAEAVGTERELTHWIGLALDYNAKLTA